MCGIWSRGLKMTSLLPIRLPAGNKNKTSSSQGFFIGTGGWGMESLPSDFYLHLMISFHAHCFILYTSIGGGKSRVFTSNFFAVFLTTLSSAMLTPILIFFSLPVPSHTFRHSFSSRLPSVFLLRSILFSVCEISCVTTSNS